MVISASDAPEDLNDASMVDPKQLPSSGSTRGGGGVQKRSLSSNKATPPAPAASGTSDKVPIVMDVDDDAEMDHFAAPDAASAPLAKPATNAAKVRLFYTDFKSVI